jgi:hypothetical protein
MQGFALYIEMRVYFSSLNREIVQLVCIRQFIYIPIYIYLYTFFMCGNLRLSYITMYFMLKRVFLNYYLFLNILEEIRC